MSEITRRDFLDLSWRGVTGVLGLSAGGYFLGCGEEPHENGAKRGDLLFDGKIDGKRLVYYEGWGDATDDNQESDILEIYSGEKKEELFRDHDENGVIGNDTKDRYIIYLGDGKKRVYAKTFVIDENGRKFSGDDSIVVKALEVAKEKLEEATTKYQDYKTKIQERLEIRLS